LRKQRRLRYEEEDDDDGIPAARPELGRAANLANALARRFGGAVRIRESDANQVIFDHRGMNGQSTMRLSYHYEDGQFMFGDPTQVKPKLVYLNLQGDSVPSADDAERQFVDRYNMDEDPQVPVGVKPKWPMKADPLGGLLPQEIVTGDIMRGYGPRRGNLERLLRYWRPIMKKPGGFRRCRVILANHPELYPLNNICAWLHHETTGLWPNEGCHHPGMKNCRKKMRGVVNGSIWNDSEWNSRLRKLTGKKSDGSFDMSDVIEIFGDMGDETKNDMMMEDVAESLAMSGEPDYEPMSDEDGDEKAYMALRDFMNAEPEFVSYMSGDDNWVIEGEDDNGETVEVSLLRSSGGDDDCGCGGDPMAMLAAFAAALADMGKSAEDGMQVKAGRVINASNLKKLRDAFALLQDVLMSGGGTGDEIEMKGKGFLVKSESTSVFHVKQMLDPVLDHYGINAEANEFGVEILDIADINDDAYEALMNVVANIDRVYGR